MRDIDIGIVGLGVMGQNLALNLQHKGFQVAGFDLDAEQRAAFSRRAASGTWIPADLPTLMTRLKAPRRLLLMVPAGAAVDAVLEQMLPILSEGDIVVDGGNSLYRDTERRLKSVQARGVLYVGSGVSGGEEGALRGPALMPGGDARAWPVLAPLMTAMAARADDGRACAEWVGTGGSGHFVKMVHNGIEYADMQLIAEAYGWMQSVLGLSATEMAEQLSRWNEGELHSYLIELSADILRCRDAESGQALVDVVLDQAEQKGTGRWTAQTALELGVTAPTIADAVFARSLSAQKPERAAAARVLHAAPLATGLEPEPALESLRRALYASKLCAYAQGFALLAAAEREFAWGLRMAPIAQGWRAGCIIRASFLDEIALAFQEAPALSNLLVAPRFAQTLNAYAADWRWVVGLAARHGVWSPCLMSALSYFDGYRAERLSANLIQAQRDAFGAHSYRRVDRDGVFHSDWRSPV